MVEVSFKDYDTKIFYCVVEEPFIDARRSPDVRPQSDRSLLIKIDDSTDCMLHVAWPRLYRSVFDDSGFELADPPRGSLSTKLIIRGPVRTIL